MLVWDVCGALRAYPTDAFILSLKVHSFPSPQVRVIIFRAPWHVGVNVYFKITILFGKVGISSASEKSMAVFSLAGISFDLSSVTCCDSRTHSTEGIKIAECFIVHFRQVDIA